MTWLITRILSQVNMLSLKSPILQVKKVFFVLKEIEYFLVASWNAKTITMVFAGLTAAFSVPARLPGVCECLHWLTERDHL